jgi:biopolymer transport protein ExbB
MKKLFAFLAVFGMLTFGVSSLSVAQDEGTTETEEAVADTATADSAEATQPEEEATEEVVEEGSTEGEATMHQILKRQFIEGDPRFMGFVLLALILGLALSIERIIYLNLASTNTSKLLNKVEQALGEGGVEAAKDVCRNTRGPVASIFYQGLDRADEGIEVVEKSVVSYGSVQMGLLERGLTWISLMISIAPMLGFMGTVIGMISAFTSIQAMGDINPSVVAGGIKVALITTVSGLIVAIILQIFYNYIISKIDAIVNNMEDASISLIDILVKHNQKNQ